MPEPSERSKADFPVIVASVPSYTLEKMASNALSIESVRTNVPLTIVTPRITASAVSAVRSFRPAMPFSENLIIAS